MTTEHTFPAAPMYWAFRLADVREANALLAYRSYIGRPDNAVAETNRLHDAWVSAARHASNLYDRWAAMTRRTA